MHLHKTSFVGCLVEPTGKPLVIIVDGSGADTLLIFPFAKNPVFVCSGRMVTSGLGLLTSTSPNQDVMFYNSSESVFIAVFILNCILAFI